MEGGGRTRESGDQITDKLRVSEEKGRNRGRRCFEDGEYDSKSSTQPRETNPTKKGPRPPLTTDREGFREGRG